MSSMKVLQRYWHTLRHLRPVQFYGRLWFRLARPKPDLSPASTLRAICGTWVTPAARSPSVTGPDSFVFLDEPGNLAEHGWDDPAMTKLWRYNQHYFDDLNAEGAETRRVWHLELINRWIVENTPAQGSGWEPYPVSLRIVNWVKYALSGGELSDTALHSLAVQSRWLTKRLEWHLLGNHLFANAKALLYAGLFFDGPEAEKWRAQATSILSRELTEQILSDGGQFELTPMYHALAVEDVADIVNLMNAFESTLTPKENRLVKDCTARLPSMLHWLDAMSHPDGQISFFNDAAFGIAPKKAVLHAYATRLGLKGDPLSPALTYLSDSGYAHIERGSAVVICDIGRIGPDYLPGHAHADTLSFELSLGVQRVIVNSGTSVYGLGTERLRQRGTAAHNTVTVEGEDSSEVWSGFRVARRAHVEVITTKETPDALIVSAQHDGYRRLPNGPIHRREWQMSSTCMTITDQLDPVQQGVAHYHLHPDVEVETTGTDRGTLRLPSGQVLKWNASGSHAKISPATWHPRFGQSVPCQCLSIVFSGLTTFKLDWA